MKKWIFIAILAIGLGGLTWKFWGFQMTNPWLDPKDDKVIRGDLVIPVSASGSVTENQRVELKSKASGRVMKILVKDGQMVTKGQELARINPVDEQRAVERLESDLARVTASVATAQIQLEEAQNVRPLDTKTAEALAGTARAQMELQKIDLDKTKGLDPLIRGAVELAKIQALYDGAKAAYDKAMVDLDRAKINEQLSIRSAREQVRVAEATQNVAKKALDEEKEKLSECNVISPIDGMVYAIPVTEGQVIQSGTVGFTGGTALMFLSDIHKLYVVAQVDEADIGAVLRIAPDFARPGSVREISDVELTESAKLAPINDTPSGSQPASQPAEPIEIEGVSGHRVHITVDAFRDKTYEGIIEQVLPAPRQAGSVTTFDVRIRLVGTTDSLRDLLSKQADVTFTADRRRGVLKVKNEAIVSEGKEAFVYVPFKEGNDKKEFEKKVKVQIGLTDGTYTEIIAGLNEGDRVWIKRPQRTDNEKETAKKKKA